ncbi:MAG: signal peptidase I [Prevotellaceae bacterium]|nr:signal peptidase I [Prevotellaceae bacterium]
MSKQNPVAAFRKSGKKTKIKFGVATLIYILFVLWLQSPVWFIGLFVIYDLYFTKWVKWAFWKKRYKKGEKHNVWLDWLDSIIFAIIVASVIRIFFIEAYLIPSSSMEKTLLVGDYLFVSKFAYGPKIPNRPLSVPLVHNQITLFGKTMKSYSDLIKNPYRRLAGLGRVKRNDIVVFNFPNGDTVVLGNPDPKIIDYHAQKRVIGKQFNEWLKINNLTLQSRPIDKKDHYVKRCVAIPGDSLEIRHGQLFINGEPAQEFPAQEYNYSVELKEALSPKIISKLNLSNEDRRSGYKSLPLTKKSYEELKNISSVTSITRNEFVAPDESNYFPFSKNYAWSMDNYGPLWIPKQGATVEINVDNLCLYQRIITAYECNTLEVKDNRIYINGEQTDKYTFKMDYYFMMGDNRHGSYDSRSWGFVPEDHVVGKPLMIWFSSDKDQSFPKSIRWNRLFNIIN